MAGICRLHARSGHSGARRIDRLSAPFHRSDQPRVQAGRRREVMKSRFGFSVLLLAGAASLAGSNSLSAQGGWGTVKGRIVLDAKVAPAPQPIAVGRQRRRSEMPRQWTAVQRRMGREQEKPGRALGFRLAGSGCTECEIADSQEPTCSPGQASRTRSALLHVYPTCPCPSRRTGSGCQKQLAADTQRQLDRASRTLVEISSFPPGNPLSFRI